MTVYHEPWKLIRTETAITKLHNKKIIKWEYIKKNYVCCASFDLKLLIYLLVQSEEDCAIVRRHYSNTEVYLIVLHRNLFDRLLSIMGPMFTLHNYCESCSLDYLKRKNEFKSCSSIPEFSSSHCISEEFSRFVVELLFSKMAVVW